MITFVIFSLVVLAALGWVLMRIANLTDSRVLGVVVIGGGLCLLSTVIGTLIGAVVVATGIPALAAAIVLIGRDVLGRGYDPLRGEDVPTAVPALRGDLQSLGLPTAVIDNARSISQTRSLRCFGLLVAGVGLSLLAVRQGDQNLWATHLSDDLGWTNSTGEFGGRFGPLKTVLTVVPWVIDSNWMFATMLVPVVMLVAVFVARMIATPTPSPLDRWSPVAALGVVLLSWMYATGDTPAYLDMKPLLLAAAFVPLAAATVMMTREGFSLEEQRWALDERLDMAFVSTNVFIGGAGGETLAGSTFAADVVAAASEAEAATAAIIDEWAMARPGTLVRHSLPLPYVDRDGVTRTADADHVVVRGAKAMVIDTKMWQQGNFDVTPNVGVWKDGDKTDYGSGTSERASVEIARGFGVIVEAFYAVTNRQTVIRVNGQLRSVPQSDLAALMSSVLGDAPMIWHWFAASKAQRWVDKGMVEVVVRPATAAEPLAPPTPPASTALPPPPPPPQVPALPPRPLPPPTLPQPSF